MAFVRNLTNSRYDGRRCEAADANADDAMHNCCREEKAASS